MEINDSHALKLFISYSHKDEAFINEFRIHITQLRDNGYISDWYDRKILGGDKFQDTIDYNLDKSDIICLFISSDFLASRACMNELQRAIDLMDEKKVRVVPIILRNCAWRDNSVISSLMALPNDGKEISSFTDKDSAWMNVYEGLKSICEQKIEENKKLMEERIRNLKNTDDFDVFLESTDFLQESLSDSRKLKLGDVFVFPEFQSFDDCERDEERVDSENVLKDFVSGNSKKIIIFGDGQSGKTSWCKMLYRKLRQKQLIPVYISDKENRFQGSLENKIEKAFYNQYGNACDFKEIDADALIVIVDDFSTAEKKEKHLNVLSNYKRVVLIVDDAFNLDIRYGSLTNDYKRYKLLEYKPSLRDALIRKWLHISDDCTNDDYRKIDDRTEVIDNTLGKILGNGIMPSYPFFILSVVSMYDTAKPINEEISSQGYCYQALLYFYLRKNGVANEDVDEYLNFLTLFAHEVFKNKGNEISNVDFEEFYANYYEEYNVTIKKDNLIATLCVTNILRKSSCNNYSFAYEYLYYFFAGRFFAENEDKCISEIKNIASNLHEEANAYIAIFISHHSKKALMLNSIIDNSKSYFRKFKEASLTRDEFDFFDKQAKYIIQASIPQENVSDNYRAEQLKLKDEIESQRAQENLENNSMDEDEFAVELKNSIKSVDVLGQILKNRSGSFPKKQLEDIFLTAMNVNLRIINSFIALIKDDSAQNEIINFLSSRIKSAVEKNNKTIDQNELLELSSRLFWNINYIFIFSCTDRIAKSIGSKKLLQITESVCDRINTPASEIVKHSILMWYDKNVRIDDIEELMNRKDFSYISKMILKYNVAEFCMMHRIDYKDAAKIHQQLQIPIYVIQKNMK